MKLSKLIQRTTATVLVSAMALSISVPALAETWDAAYEAGNASEAVVYDTDSNVIQYGIKVTFGNTEYAVTSQNYNDVLGNSTLAYTPNDPANPAKGGTLSCENGLSSGSLVINVGTSAGPVDVKLNNANGGIVVNGALTVDGAYNVTVVSENAAGNSAYGSVINGNVTITDCTGDVLLENKGTGDVVGGSSSHRLLKVDGAHDVTVRGVCSNSSKLTYTIFGSAEINCTGDVEITSDQYRAVLDSLKVTSAWDVTVSGTSSSSALIGSTANITCFGTVTLNNKDTGKAVGSTLTYTPAAAASYDVETGSGAANVTTTHKTGGTYSGTHSESYIRIVAAHEHTLGEWESDGTNHWKTCSTCKKKVNEGEHTLGDWESNETSHWKTCSTCNETVDEGKHDFGEDGNAKTCAECGYANPNYKEPEHQHTAGTEWESDETSHWHTCTTCDENVQFDKAEHDFGEDSNAKTCAVCGYANPNYKEPEQPEHQHTAGTEWKSDSTSHWHACTTCAEDVQLNKAEHNFGEDGNAKTCAECGAANPNYEEPDQPDTPDVPDDSGDSGSAVGAVVAGAAIGGTALFVGYEVVTDTILGNLLPEGADTPVNRGQLAWLIWGTKGAPEPEHQPSFTDVSDPEMAKAAQWCVEQGLMDAKSDTTFAPNGWTPKFRVIETWNRAFPKN